MAKRGIRETLWGKHNIDLADKLAKMIKNEEKLYNKSYKLLKKHLIDSFGAESTVKIKDTKTGVLVEVKTSKIVQMHTQSFHRLFKMIESAMKYAHPQMKAIEVKSNEQGQIAFNVNIPNIETKKEKKKENASK